MISSSIGRQGVGGIYISISSISLTSLTYWIAVPLVLPLTRSLVVVMHGNGNGADPLRPAQREKVWACLPHVPVSRIPYLVLLGTLAFFQAGTGCGGCEPMVKDIFALAMKSSGLEISTDICEHFKYTRKELFDIVKVSKVELFTCSSDRGERQGKGCLTPAVAIARSS